MPQGIDFERQKTLESVSFTVERGEWVALLGANGSGKSTVARLANGLLLPNDGEVIADGVSSWQHDRLLELRKLVGLVTQDPDNQIVSTTVFDEVAFGPQNLSWEPERIYKAVSESLARVGLSESEFAKRDPNTLSGGEKQRVVIAATLAMEPHYLALDEPTAMLDPKARAQVLEAISSAVQSNQGVLHITHLLKEASFADRVLVLSEGRIVYSGAPEPILSNKAALIRYGLWAEPTRWGCLPIDERTANKPSSSKERESYVAADAGAATPQTLLFEEVSFTYPAAPEEEAALDNTNFSLKAGDFLLLVGASGSGKSTLLSLAAGLLQPSKGTVLLKGDAPQPGQVGLVFQQPETQLFAQTIKEDILFGPKNLGMPIDKMGDALVDEVLSAVGLAPGSFKDRSPFSLSGGEARRVAIATTLALDTDFLLLDEPTAGLDARGRVFIYELLQTLLAKGKGIVVATHDPNFFESLASSRMEL